MSTRERVFGIDRRELLGREIPLPPRPLRQATSVVGFFVLWWAAVQSGFLDFRLFPGPIETVTAFVGYLGGEPVLSGQQSIYVHAAYSTFRVVAGVVLAALTAIPLGLLIGTSTKAGTGIEWHEYLYPGLESLRSIPPVAWVPAAILLFPVVRAFGFEVSTAVLFVVFIGSFFPILVNTVQGVQNLDDEFRRAAQSLGADGRQIFRHVIFPAALPSILTGLSLGIGLGWITVVAAEIIAGNYGLGYIIYQAYRLLQTDVIAVGMVSIGLLGYASSALVARIADYATPWSDIETSQ
jgi:NitT/TauT family transport system permease protein